MPSFNVLELNKFSSQPGVYLMKDAVGEYLYIGKAKNLKQRIKQYFVSGGDGRVIIPFLVSQIATIDTIIVTSEKEALILENNLIKKHWPKYNALLKDDKSYIGLKVNNKNLWPTVSLVRYKGKPEPDGLYFGPYTSANAARSTLDLIQKTFPLRQCSDQEFARRTRPCILYDMKRCIAPCVKKCTKEEYQSLVDRVIRFLKGNDKEILQELYQEMEKEAEALEFEKANELLKKIRYVENTLEIQHVDKALGGNSDAFAIFRQGDEVILGMIQIRNGKLINSTSFPFSKIAETDPELFSSFIFQHYQLSLDLPDEILLPLELPDSKTLEDLLSVNKKRKIKIFSPQRGSKLALIELAFINAEAIFKKEKDHQAIREKTLLEMQETFHLLHYPKIIECFDNSHTAGKEAVSALVSFLDGEKDKKNYRKYKLQNTASSDDYGAMKEVLLRRYKRAKEENILPDLVIIDGGKGHLHIAEEVFKELNVINVDIIAVAKEAGRHDKGLSREQVFLKDQKEPILLKHNSSILFLLQQIRDEAHRFAITFHRLKRQKSTLKTALLDIPGIGPAKSKALLRHFGSLKKVQEATLEELQSMKGLSKSNIDAILVFTKKL